MAIRFAFLVMEEHPYGREMLRALLARGQKPALVIEEGSSQAELEREKFLTRISGQPVPPLLSESLAASGITRHRVADHNDESCRDLLEAFEPELVVLGGTGIIRPHLITIPTRGTVNAHPGLLPQLRGSSSVAWAVFLDLPIGCTCHFVDDRIDTGPIILRRDLGVRREETYEQIVRRMLTLAGQLMADTLDMFDGGEVHAAAQIPAAGNALRVIPLEYLELAKARLAEGRYSHYLD